MRFATLALALLMLVAAPLHAQPSATVRGAVLDAFGGALPGATVTIRNESSGFDRSVVADADGTYFVAGVPAGPYRVVVTAPGFRSEVIEELTLEVGRTLLRDFHLSIGGQNETVVVRGEAQLLDRATAVVGHVVTPQTVQEIPLNGRHFVDLGLLVPGSVAPSQTGFSTTPIRGVGALAINTAGNREEAVGFLVNGVTSNNLTFGSLMFEPPIASVQEFKVDNSTFSVEHGHVSGAIVSIITRSGTERVQGELFEYLRNDALDARNYFELTTADPHPFERNQFGGSLGGPLVSGRTFFFVTYEGLRQRQGLDMNSLVLSREQRDAVTDPGIRRLVDMIPLPNFVDTAGNQRFVGAAAARVDVDRWTVDVRQNFGRRDRFHAYFGRQSNRAIEPASQGTSIPGFGHDSNALRSLLTLDETRILGSEMLNEARFGISSLDGAIVPVAPLNPADFGIRNGVTRKIGLPQMQVTGGLNFGGPAVYPQGRTDASYVFADTLSAERGRHTLKMGGEYRRFLNENFVEGTGSFNFPSVEAFLRGDANAFSITLGERRNHIRQRAMALFFQDGIAVRSNLTVELGLRYEWHVTPTERDNQFVVFDADSSSLLRVGVDLDEIHRQNNRNLEPRIGIVWEPSRRGRTVVRAAFGWAVDEPGTTAVRDTAANPPFALPLSAAGTISLGSALATTQSVRLAPATIDPQFTNASMHTWNLNVQRQIGGDMVASIGVFGSRGKNLRITRNINQPVDGVSPFAALSSDSPISPGAPLGNIMQVESSAFSRYDALWISAARRLSRGLEFDTSYTWSKSLDTNSLNSQGFAVQDSYDIPNQYGLSDFHAGHRFVLSTTYAVPFDGHWIARDWQFAAIVQAQSGNPVNIVTSTSTINGMPNTVRPDVTGPIRIIGTPDQWFDPSVFVAVNRFGNLGRNVVIGPGFRNTDLSISRTVRLGTSRLRFRADVFNLFNHANFGPPGNIVGSPAFGRITRTRLATGESGSSRQIQLAVTFSF